jgi:hypothetical protein
MTILLPLVGGSSRNFWKVDPKTGRGYYARSLPPETEEFARARARIIKEMKENGFDEFFKKDERYHVDPSNYPPNVDTLTITPKRQATINKYMSEYGSAASRQELRDAVTRGAQMPDASDWYALGQVEQRFIEFLGPKAGRDAFRDLVTSLAATTAGADPTTNLLMALYGNYLRRRSLPYPKHAYELHYPIGGRFAMANMRAHQKFFDEGGWEAIGANNPKRHDHGQSFFGNLYATPIDQRLMPVLAPGRLAPARNTYGLAAQVVHQEAALAGQLPHRYRDLAWAGIGHNSAGAGQPPASSPTVAASRRVGIGHNSAGAGQLPPADWDLPPPTVGHRSRHQPMIAYINEAIERTHRLTGMPREEVFIRGFILGQIPIYGIGGLAILPALRSQRGNEPSAPAAADLRGQ